MAVERLGLRENLRTGREQSGSGPDPAVSLAAAHPVAKHRPKPGQIVVEIYDSDRELLFFDRIPGDPLPAAPTSVAGRPATRIVNPDGRVHQEITLTKAEAATDSLALPNYILDRSDAAFYSLWWSCHEK